MLPSQRCTEWCESTRAKRNLGPILSNLINRARVIKIHKPCQEKGFSLAGADVWHDMYLWLKKIINRNVPWKSKWRLDDIKTGADMRQSSLARGARSADTPYWFWAKPKHGKTLCHTCHPHSCCKESTQHQHPQSNRDLSTSPSKQDL